MAVRVRAPSVLDGVARSQLARRLVRGLALATFVAVDAFILMRMVPGDPARLILGDVATDEDVAALRAQLGFDGPFHEQLAEFLGGLLRGDLGWSVSLNQPVSVVIAQSVPATLWLVGMTLAITLGLAVPLGFYVALKRGSAVERAFIVISSLSLAMPVFFVSIVLILLISIALQALPVAGYVEAFPRNLLYLILPAVAMSTHLVPMVARVVSSSIARTLDEEFVETAVVHGLPRWTRIRRYILRPSLGPTVALVSYMFAEMLGSAVLVQVIFGLPGIGFELISAVRLRDYPLVQGIVAVLGVAVVAVTFFADSISAAMDPRIASASR